MIKFIECLEGTHWENEATISRKVNEIIKYINNNNEIKNNNYISKDKIKEKIKEIHNYTFMSLEEREQQDYAISKLEELLED